MGAIYSYIFGPAEPEQADPETGLTLSQVKLLQEIWKLVEKDIKEVGVKLMIDYLTEYPEYVDVFVKFRGMSMEEIEKSRAFHAHCLNIMGVFTQAVQYLEDAELSIAGIVMAGERHGRRGQDPMAFDLLQPFMGKTIKEKLGAKCTPQVSEALDIFIGFVFAQMQKSIVDYKQKKKQAAS